MKGFGDGTTCQRGGSESDSFHNRHHRYSRYHRRIGRGSAPSAVSSNSPETA